MVFKQLKTKDIPRIKSLLMKKQGYICPICKRDLNKLETRDRCLDHNHTSNRVRAVLCRACNSFEGKIQRSFIRIGLRKTGIPLSHILFELSEYLLREETEYLYPIKNKKKRSKRGTKNAKRRSKKDINKK